MERSRKDAPKTIRIRYPLLYSQPGTKAETNAPITSKPKKRKPRMNSYSAQSWGDKEKNVGKLKPTRPSSSRPTNSQTIANRNNPRSPRRASVQFCPCRSVPIRRPDASQPHLKYGVFNPPAKPALIGNLSSAIISKPSLRKRAPVDTVKKERRPAPTQQEVIELPETEVQPSDMPTLVFRPLFRHHTQRLSSSDIVHLDIKPGNYRFSPPRLPRVTIL